MARIKETQLRGHNIKKERETFVRKWYRETNLIEVRNIMVETVYGNRFARNQCL